MIKPHSQANLPESEKIRVRCDESSMENLVAILWAVHEVQESSSCLKAIVAPLHMKAEMEKTFKVVGKACQENLTCDVLVYFCVPLSESEHLPLRIVSVR